MNENAGMDTDDTLRVEADDTTLGPQQTSSGGEPQSPSTRPDSETSRRITDVLRRYDNVIRKRLRMANLAALGRAGGIQMVWLLVLAAGAAIPLSEAIITDGWTWVSPVLGFVVVVAAGLERIFGRTTNAALALDRLRRDLTRERRLLIAEGSREDHFDEYVARVEEAFAHYDRAMVEYHSQIVGESSRH